MRDSAATSSVPALELRWHGRVRRFDPHTTIRVGSGIHAQVRLPGIDRAHATLRVVEGRWVLTDHSASGTTVAGEPLGRWPVEGLTFARFGGSEPVCVQLEPVSAAEGCSDTGNVGSGRSVVEPGTGCWRQQRESERRLSISWGQRELVAAPGEMITVGSLGSCDLVVDHPRVAAVHLRMRWSDDRWVVEPIDLGASITIDERPLVGRTALAGSVRLGLGAAESEVRLGGPDDVELMVFAPGLASSRRRWIQRRRGKVPS